MIGLATIPFAVVPAMLDWTAISPRELCSADDLPAAVEFDRQGAVETSEAGPDRLRVLLIETMPLLQQFLQTVPTPSTRVVVFASAADLAKQGIPVADAEFAAPTADSHRNLVRLLHGYILDSAASAVPTPPVVAAPQPPPTAEAAEQHPNRLRALIADFSHAVRDVHIRTQAIDLWARVLTQQTEEPLDLSAALDAGASRDLVTRMIRSSADAAAQKLQQAYAVMCAEAPLHNCVKWTKADGEELKFLTELLPPRWSRVFYNLNPDVERLRQQVRAVLAKQKQKQGKVAP